MKTTQLNFNTKNNVSFSGTEALDTKKLAALKRFVNCGLNKLETNLEKAINEKAPQYLAGTEGAKYILDDTGIQKVKSGVKSFIGMPLDIINAIAKKFPDLKLNNAKFLKNYRASLQLENEIRALQGIQKKGLEFLQEVIPDGKYPPTTSPCSQECQDKCNRVAEKFNKLLNNAMADDKATYDTKKERFWARITSGFTAAFFLGNDFYNKSIKKGKSKEEAKKEQHLKQYQEVKENICEAVTQFAVFACFSKFVNKNVWASAVIGAGIGLVSRIVSRVSSGMPITRIKVPNQYKTTMPSLAVYQNAAKEGRVESLPKEKLQKTEEKEGKKPVLSLKNILLFCGVSIAGGYALRFLKGHTIAGKSIEKMLKTHTDKVNKGNIEDIFAPREKLNKLADVLSDNEESSLLGQVRKLLMDNKEASKFLIGTDYKKTKLFGKIEVNTKDLKDLTTAPFRFVKELVSYPYKIVSKLENAIKNSLSKGAKATKAPEPLQDVYGIKNIYKRFLEFEAKYGDDDKKLAEEFGNYLRQMRLLSNNDVTSSSFNNSKIAVIAQTLGTLTGMWFNMNDEFNSSVRNGATKSEAQKDARLRGINKFFRMTVQLIISGSLNNIFSKQYNASIGNAALVVAISTILTDAASRVMTGMPSRKMTKEELEKYQKEHKEGVMAAYYKAIDKLAS